MPTWDELFHDAKHRWLEPHEEVVRWVERMPRRNGSRILDLGCGAGRHLVFMARQGYQVFGMEICDLQELAYELRSFVIRDVHLDEHPVEGDPDRFSSHWEIWVEKPAERIMND